MRKEFYMKCNVHLFFVVLMFSLSGSMLSQESRSDKLRKLYLENDRNNNLNKNRVWLMAHRGLWDDQYPESSLGAFQNAIDNDFEIIELDVLFSAPYYYEDITLNMTSATGQVIDNGMKLKECVRLKKKATGRFKIEEVDGKIKPYYRAIIFSHDGNDQRIKGDNNQKGFGLFRHFRDDNKKNNDKISRGREKEFTPFKNNLYSFLMLQTMVPYEHNNILGIMGFGSNGADPSRQPVLLHLDGSDSASKMIMYNPAEPITTTSDNGNLVSKDPFNAEMIEFFKAVKGKILINIDKLKTKEDFVAVTDLMRRGGVLDQCIFKGKGLTNIKDIYKLFEGGLHLYDKIIFTPTFTEFDFDVKRDENFRPVDVDNNPIPKNSFVSKQCVDEDERRTKYLEAWKAINVSKQVHAQVATEILSKIIDFDEQDNLNFSAAISKNGNSTTKHSYQSEVIAIAGAEVVFTKDLTEDNTVNQSITVLAKQIFSDKKRVVQFGALPESKKGAWTGGQAQWMGTGRFSKNNFWEFIYDNRNLSKTGQFDFFADVYVGDKPIEFRGYLNAMGYNMKPIP